MPAPGKHTTEIDQMHHRAHQLMTTIAFVAAAGVGVSLLSLRHHYRTDATPYCDIGSSFNCDIVNRSTYSVIAGIPVAMVGVLGYAALLVLATIFRNYRNTPVLLLSASLVGLGFALYLTYIESSVLATWCILCLLSLGLITCEGVFTGLLFIQSRRARSNKA
ncbi:MAG: vitamin K epoxide reductase family protein [Acidobacteriales bacterium]|nr:vitamin K epoxide reductase family protein [Terriglobales bacterium]